MIPLTTPLETELQKVMDKIFPTGIMSPNLYRILAKNKPLFNELVNTRFLSKKGLFYSTRINDSLREKIILRTSIVCNNYYEYELHIQTISQQMGLTIKQIEDVKNKKLNESLWSSEELLLFQFIERLVKKHRVSNQLFSKLKTFFSEELLLDLTLIIGFYSTAAMVAALSKPKTDNYIK